MNKIIIHVDMDAFFASVEVRDNPLLRGKPLIIGSLPNERGVVSTCSYEARKFGVRSAMNIKDAYRLCPKGIYMHPNYEKYKIVSKQLHDIWDFYATESEAVALDEAYLDVTEKAIDIDGARKIAHIIKNRIKNELRLTCSVGIGYSKIAAKTASEEKKPDGYYEILSPSEFVNLVIDRDVQALYTVGVKTANKLKENGIYTIRDIQIQKEKVVALFGKRGKLIVDLSFGNDERELKRYSREDAKSISREITFQKDVKDIEFLKDVLFLLSLCVEYQMNKYHLFGSGVTLKITYFDMKTITRSRSTYSCDFAILIYKEAVKMLDQIENKPIRLIGIGVYNLSKEFRRQLSLDDCNIDKNVSIEGMTHNEFLRLKEKYHLDFYGNLAQLYKMQILFRTIEYMRKYKNKK